MMNNKEKKIKRIADYLQKKFLEIGADQLTLEIEVDGTRHRIVMIEAGEK